MSAPLNALQAGLRAAQSELSRAQSRASVARADLTAVEQSVEVQKLVVAEFESAIAALTPPPDVEPEPEPVEEPVEEPEVTA